MRILSFRGQTDQIHFHPHHEFAELSNEARFCRTREERDTKASSPPISSTRWPPCSPQKVQHSQKSKHQYLIHDDNNNSIMASLLAPKGTKYMGRWVGDDYQYRDNLMASLLAPKSVILCIVQCTWVGVGELSQKSKYQYRDYLMASQKGGSPSAWLPLPLEARSALLKINFPIFDKFDNSCFSGQHQAIQGIKRQG